MRHTALSAAALDVSGDAMTRHTGPGSRSGVTLEQLEEALKLEQTARGAARRLQVSERTVRRMMNGLSIPRRPGRPVVHPALRHPEWLSRQADNGFRCDQIAEHLNTQLLASGRTSSITAEGVRSAYRRLDLTPPRLKRKSSTSRGAGA